MEKKPTKTVKSVKPKADAKAAETTEKAVVKRPIVTDSSKIESAKTESPKTEPPKPTSTSKTATKPPSPPPAPTPIKHSLQLASDTHVEFWGVRPKYNFISPCGTILALLGDIGCCATDSDFECYKQFIMEQVGKFKCIFIIAGNHEYYYNSTAPATKAHTIAAIEAKIRAFTKTLPNTHFLNNNCIKLDINGEPWSVIGTTLWTSIPKDQMQRIEGSMNDYKQIYVDDGDKHRLLKAEDVNLMHRKSLAYLRTAITKSIAEKRKVLVLTHHKPFPEANYSPTEMNPAYESDLTSLMVNGVKLWLYGHTHVSKDLTINTTRILCNPKGYPRQRTLFKEDLVVEFA